MKATKTICAALVLTVMMASCTREAEINDAISTERELVFTAGWADGSEEDSRTVLQANGTSIWWTVSEEINLFVGKDVSAKFISTNTQPQHIVSFAGNVMIGYPEDDEAFPGYWAVYPYNKDNSCDGNSVRLEVNSRQTAAEGTFADKCFPAIARSLNFSLAFWNVCGGARFSVTREGVKRVVFRSNDGSPMVGKVRVGFGEDGKPQILDITEPVDSVVLNAKDGSLVPGANYFSAMLPQTHAQGLTVTLYTATQRAVKTISKPITIHRSAFGMLDNVDKGLIYTDATLPEDEDDDTPYEMVDLGLSVKWATCNVGASSPTEYGDYFAWGETEPKEDYSWETYKWCMGGDSYDVAGPFTKYCTNSQYGYNGFMDNKVILDPEDDAAMVNLGGKWRTPTYDEWKELQENCIWKYTALIDREGFSNAGYKVTSKKAGYTDRWIFLPTKFAGGVWSTYANGAYSGLYWSSSLCYSWGSPNFAYSIDLSSTQPQRSSYRSSGHSVRPVYGEFIHVTGVSVSPGSAMVVFLEPLQLTATISPVDATEKGVEWSSSNESVATVTADGLVTAVGKGTADITVRTADGGFTASCTISVHFELIVDLGLSVNWASLNVGASYPWEYGDYFAWGETESKEDYSWPTYKWSMGSNKTMTKYCTNSSYGYNGFTDNMTVLDPDDDAATANWGGIWRMPTVDEFYELRTQCTWTWTTLNGVNGMKVTSNKEGYTNKSLFLPAVGILDGSNLEKVGYYGYYWSSSLSSDYTYCASSVYVSQDVNGWRLNRYYGQSVRPVCE